MDDGCFYRKNQWNCNHLVVYSSAFFLESIEVTSIKVNSKRDYIETRWIASLLCFSFFFLGFLVYGFLYLNFYKEDSIATSIINQFVKLIEGSMFLWWTSDDSDSTFALCETLL